MNNGFRIPTLLAIILVSGLIAALGVFSDDARILLGRAATPSSTIPQSVEVTNVTDTAAVVFWKSSDVVATTIVIPSINTTFYDVRDSDSLPKPYKLHMYSVKGLPVQKTTAFEIRAGNQTVYKGTIATGPQLPKPPQALPLYGDSPKELGEKQIFIKTTINNEIVATMFTTTPNNWAIPLAIIRTKDATNFYCTKDACGDSIPLHFSFMTEDQTIEKTATIGAARPYTSDEVKTITDDVLASTSAILSPTTTQLAKSQSPTPTVKKLPMPTKTPTPTPKKSVLGINSEVEEIAITSPTEGQALSFTKPLIRGTSISGHEVTITLSGQITQIGKTKVLDNKSWQWSPAYPLTPGKYTVSIATTDKNNKKVTRTRTFFVLKSGESVLSASTPSATLIPFPTDTLVPTPTTPLDIPTATPTIFVTAGPEVSLFFIGGGSLLLLFAIALL